MTITRTVAFINDMLTRYWVFSNGAKIGFDEVPSPAEILQGAGQLGALELRHAIVKTAVAIGLGGGILDIPVTWATAGGVAAPMPSADYRISVADTLPAGVSAVPIGRTKDGCTIRITATVLVAIGLTLDVSVWGT